MHFPNFRVFIFLVACAVSASTVVYAMPVQAGSQSTPHFQVARAPPAVVFATVKFLWPNNGPMIEPACEQGCLVQGAKDAAQRRIIPRALYPQVESALKVLIPSNLNVDVPVGYINSLQLPKGASKKSTFAMGVYGIGHCVTGCTFTVDKNGKIDMISYLSITLEEFRDLL
ncbi:hypothetical protein F5879DRAFT_401272 [Lentinula edodes]|uniref:Secreted protein n=1 Tax=Lentinula edodes TaxID=5353 RepID=A0A1Q3DZ73_LENED|nr:hypothetical protein F5879DRAFT_401272 [Lentinula edodes]GAW00308.1 hypothetical protein LENED_001815 [Lentinula edodes]